MNIFPRLRSIAALRVYVRQRGCAVFAVASCLMGLSVPLLARASVVDSQHRSIKARAGGVPGYLSSSDAPQVDIINQPRFGQSSHAVPSYRSFEERAAALRGASNAAPVVNAEGLKSTSVVEESSKGSLAADGSVNQVATNNKSRQPDRVFSAGGDPVVSELVFPRPMRESRLFNEIYLYFPVAQEETSEVSVVGGALNGAVFAPPVSPNRSSRAIYREVE